jgi:signal transduction histidine kinase
LERQLELKERFMRIASHDLRSPLCLILMAVDLARRQPVQDGTSLAKNLENIAESATQMRHIIDTFLEIRAPAPGGVGPGAVRGRLDLNLLLAAVVRQHASAAQRKEITLGCELAEALPLVRGEAGLVFQAITNFTSNALKFTPFGGRVTVGTCVTPDGVRVEVRDSGPGVPTTERELLFTENVRLSPRPTGGEESNGVGLAIVQHLVKSQGGTVGADFPDGGGSAFWFELPKT